LIVAESLQDPLSKEESPAAWSVRLCAVPDLPEDGQSVVFELEERRIAIYRVSGALYAIDDYCTHAQSSLSQDGSRCDLVVECALHRAQFSLETGKALRGPTRKPLRRYDIEVAGDEVIATQARTADMRRPPSSAMT
jgi:3-phenylpropionate/trans-cinnamate dioxygenase ferredoxin component